MASDKINSKIGNLILVRSFIGASWTLVGCTQKSGISVNDIRIDGYTPIFVTCSRWHPWIHINQCYFQGNGIGCEASSVNGDTLTVNPIFQVLYIRKIE